MAAKTSVRRIEIRLAGEGGEIEIGFQAHAQAHRREIRVFVLAGAMARRINERPLRFFAREAQRVAYLLLPHHLIIADQPGKDRQAGRVRRSPAFRPHRVRIQIVHRP